ncbi:MAG: pyridoxal phosphate-dependent aminotransferase [Faecousia sp.]
MLYQTENPHGGEVYEHPGVLDFSANINPLGTPPKVAEAVAASLPLLSRYPDPYCRDLVAAISDYEGVPKAQILCGNGAAELIFSFCSALGPKKALLPVPCFSEYETALKAVNCAVEHCRLPESRGFALTEDFLGALNAFDGELVMLCNPNNPTGRVIEKPLMERILELCRQKGIFLFVDECFLNLTEGGGELSLKEALRRAENLLLLKAFTKSYGMAGLRLGYCLSGNSGLLEKMGRSVQAWNVSLPAQLAGVAALKEQDFLRRANEIIHTQRPRMAAAMEALGLTIVPSRANFLLFYSETALRAPLLERGFQIRSCANYPGLGPGWYRIAVKLPDENRRLLKAMEEILHG